MEDMDMGITFDLRKRRVMDRQKYELESLRNDILNAIDSYNRTANRYGFETIDISNKKESGERVVKFSDWYSANSYLKSQGDTWEKLSWDTYLNKKTGEVATVNSSTGAITIHAGL